LGKIGLKALSFPLPNQFFGVKYATGSARRRLKTPCTRQNIGGATFLPAFSRIMLITFLS
jgi:hypothetical protein